MKCQDFFFLLVFIPYNLDTFEDDYIYEYYKLFRYYINKNQKDDKHSGQSLIIFFGFPVVFVI